MLSGFRGPVVGFVSLAMPWNVFTSVVRSVLPNLYCRLIRLYRMKQPRPAPTLVDDPTECCHFATVFTLKPSVAEEELKRSREAMELFLEQSGFMSYEVIRTNSIGLMVIHEW
jgi:hypothetical protein